MDHQQQAHHLAADDIASQTFTFYTTDQEAPFNVQYNPTAMSPYQVVAHNGSQTRQLSVEDLQAQGLQYTNMMMPTHQYHDPYNTSPSPHVPIPLSHSPPPPSPELYDPLSPPVSGSDTSADGLYNSSANNSPTSSRANSLVHRSHIRYNPTPSPTSSSGRRSRGRSQDSDEEEMGAYHENLAHSRKEATRRQRIEAEQRRRDELRDGYAKLKDVLPVSNQKTTNHIISLESLNQELQSRLATLEAEMHRLRALNEKISLTSNNTPSPGMFSEARPISPPPEIPSQAVIPTRAAYVPSDDSSHSSPAVSDGGGYQ
ncbi:hypothetical protein D9757_002278 [Collybiopsis confluens]|uniref:BHLH domain-containing protein n=1 Tax=Collybiopsis confluens TaxID=2823264 RepID=A0A8H5HZR2_9AGAR|nr:hypothetical protein D9757_002278 [Collybiopsis confluens]